MPAPLQLAAPRLFADDADWNALPARIARDPLLARAAVLLRERCEAHLCAPPVRHVIEGVRRLTPARLAQGRILDLATMARLDGDTRCAGRARDELLAIAALPDWGTRHFLDVAEYALGVALGLSWLQHHLTPGERDTLTDALLDRAIRPSFDVSHIWIGGRTNWTQVCHAGLVAAALATADREPALAARTIRRAVSDQAGPAAAYAPDGAYPEGPMYWIYGTTFHVVLLSLLEAADGHDHGLAQFPGFMASADFIAHLTAPGGLFFNYADSREFVPPMPVLHWFAARRQEPDIAAAELRRLHSQAPRIGGELQIIYERLDALVFWWRRPAQAACASPLPLHWRGGGANPVSLTRTAWGDPRAAFLGLKAGSASTSHAHLDAGSFVYEAGGVRWAVDPGMQEYHSLEAAGLKIWDTRAEGDRWRVFRFGLEAHNLLRFDDTLPRIEASATLSSDGAFVDLTALHTPRVHQVVRHAELASDGSLQVDDIWRTGREAVGVRWQWLTRATVEPVADGAILHQDGQALRLRILAPAAPEWSLALEEVTALLSPTDAPCPGLRRLTVKISTAANSAGALRVHAALIP